MQLALNAFGRYTASHFSPYTVKAKYVMITVFEFLTVTNIGDQLATSSERTSPCGTLQRRSFIKYGETALILIAHPPGRRYGNGRYAEEHFDSMTPLTGTVAMRLLSTCLSVYTICD